MSRRFKETFKQSVFALLISQIIIKSLGLVYKLYLTNRKGFGDEGNAISTASFQVYALILSITATGLPSAISRLVAERSANGDHKGAYKIFKVSMIIFSIIGLIGSYFLAIFSRKIANDYLNIKEAELSILALAPSVFLVSVISVFRGYFGGRENLKEQARGQTIDQVTKTISTVIFIESSVFLTINPNTKIMAACANLSATLANLFECLYLYKAYKKQRYDIGMDIKSSINSEKIGTYTILKEIILVAIPISLTAVIGTIANNIDSTTIVNKLKDVIGYEQAKKEYGILSGKVELLISFPLSFNTAISTALLPSIAASKNNLKKAENRINKSILFGSVLSIPISAIFLFYGSEILQMLFPNASSGAEILKISAISVILITMIQMLNGILYGIGKSNVPIIAVTFGLIVKAILNNVLVSRVDLPFGGTKGAAIANVMYDVVSFIITILAIKKYTKIKINKSSIIKPAIGTIILIIVSKIAFKVINVNLGLSVSLLTSLTIGLIVYIISLIVLKVFKIRDVALINFRKN